MEYEAGILVVLNSVIGLVAVEAGLALLEQFSFSIRLIKLYCMAFDLVWK